MATTCPMNFNVGYLRDQVRNTYDQVARDPNRQYHFHRGSDYAHSFLGYDLDELAALPALSTERFAGVGNPLAIGPLEPGETVLDHACGAGMDLLLAARRVGPGGAHYRYRHDTSDGGVRQDGRGPGRDDGQGGSPSGFL